MRDLHCAVVVVGVVDVNGAVVPAAVEDLCICYMTAAAVVVGPVPVLMKTLKRSSPSCCNALAVVVVVVVLMVADDIVD
jgi:hypothetical protein